MFWGLILEPNRRYTQVVTKPFHITMAAMDETTSDDAPTQVILSYQERNYLLCTLKKAEIVNVPLDLTFDTGDQISFASNGNSHIHLTGYLVDEDFPDSDSEDESEMISEVTSVSPGSKRKLAENGAQPVKKSKTLELLENVASDDESDDESVHLSDLTGMDTTNDDDDDTSDDDDEDGEEEEEEDDDGDEDEEEDDEDEEIEGEDDEEEEELVPAPQKAKLNGKAPKSERLQKDQKPDKASKKEKLSKQDKSAKGEKSPQKQQQPQSPKKENVSPKKEGGSSPLKKTIENGVTIEDLKVGQGPPAKFGKVVQVYYEGRLKSNNKMFDSSKKGPGFEFRLGRKEVIKGWDVGVQGMKVGGKRRITCPPNMAYGNKGSPPVIPPNATLVFEVELKKVL